MYCSKCGEQNSDRNSYCSKCGVALAKPQPPPQLQPQAAPVPQPHLAPERTSGMAVTSLVLGIIGFFLSPLAILAVIFGIIAMNKISTDPGLKGKGMAVAGLVLGSFGIIVTVIFIAIVIWVSANL